MYGDGDDEEISEVHLLPLDKCFYQNEGLLGCPGVLPSVFFGFRFRFWGFSFSLQRALISLN